MHVVIALINKWHFIIAFASGAFEAAHSDTTPASFFTFFAEPKSNGKEKSMGLLQNAEPSAVLTSARTETSNNNNHSTHDNNYAAQHASTSPQHESTPRNSLLSSIPLVAPPTSPPHPHTPLASASPYYVNVGWFECANACAATGVSQHLQHLHQVPHSLDCACGPLTARTCVSRLRDAVCARCAGASEEVFGVNRPQQIRGTLGRRHCLAKHLEQGETTNARYSNTTHDPHCVCSHRHCCPIERRTCRNDDVTPLHASTPARKSGRVDRITRTKRHYRRAAMTSLRNVYRISVSSESDVEFARSLRSSIARSLRSSARARNAARTTPTVQTQHDADVSETGTSTVDVDSDATTSYKRPEVRTTPATSSRARSRNSHTKPATAINLASAFVPIHPARSAGAPQSKDASSDVALSDDSVRSQFGSSDHSDSSSLTNQSYSSHLFQQLHVSTWPPDDASPLQSSAPIPARDDYSSRGITDAMATASHQFKYSSECSSARHAESVLMTSPPTVHSDLQASPRILKPLPQKHSSGGVRSCYCDACTDALLRLHEPNALRPHCSAAHLSLAQQLCDPASEECTERLEQSLPSYLTGSDSDTNRPASFRQKKKVQSRRGSDRWWSTP